MSQSDYDVRYGSNWDEIAWATRQMTGDRCCGCAHKAELTHHCYYALDIRQGGGVLFVPLVGQEQPGIQIFPMCRKCHEIVHKRKNWYHYRPCPVWGNRNYPIVILELRERFLLLKSNLVGI